MREHRAADLIGTGINHHAVHDAKFLNPADHHLLLFWGKAILRIIVERNDQVIDDPFLRQLQRVMIHLLIDASTFDDIIQKRLWDQCF
ncbi:hypothetical protein D3C73_1438410 [compost metagenome]